MCSHFSLGGQTHGAIFSAVPVINVRQMPQFSYMLNTDFEWHKSTHKQSHFGIGLEISRFDYQLLPRLRSQHLRAPEIFLTR